MQAIAATLMSGGYDGTEGEDGSRDTTWTDFGSVCGYAERLAAELAALRERVGPDYHVYEQRPDGWSVKHPLACRDEMLDCPVHLAASAYQSAPVKPGRWRVEIGPDGDLDFAAFASVREPAGKDALRETALAEGALPCGHPAAAVVDGGEGTSYCGVCAALAASPASTPEAER